MKNGENDILLGYFFNYGKLHAVTNILKTKTLEEQ